MINEIRAIQERTKNALSNTKNALSNILYAEGLVDLASIDIPWLCELALAYRERMQELVLIAEPILEHLEELEEAWRRGALHESDTPGGTRSNRNVTLARQLRQVLANRPESKESDG